MFLNLFGLALLLVRLFAARLIASFVFMTLRHLGPYAAKLLFPRSDEQILRPEHSVNFFFQSIRLYTLRAEQLNFQISSSYRICRLTFVLFVTPERHRPADPR